MKTKMRSELRGEHVHTTFFMGEEGCTLANAGTLVMDIGQAQVLLAAIIMGADRTAGRLVAEHEGYLSAAWAAEQDVRG